MTDKIVYKPEVETNDGINELSTKAKFGQRDRIYDQVQQSYNDI